MTVEKDAEKATPPVPLPGQRTRWGLANYPPPEEWDRHTQADPKTREPRDYMLIPTICFNCESACGLLAYVDKDDRRDPQVRGQPGPPRHPRAQLRQGPGDDQPGPRPRAHPVPAASASATRGAGKFERGHLGRGARRHRRPDPQGDRRGPPRRGHVPRRPPRRGRLHRARAPGLGRRRPQQPHQRLLSAAARTGYTLWCGSDRPSPDYAERQVHRCCSRAPRDRPLLQPARAAHHRGASRTARSIAVARPRLSNTASHADHWIAPWPGSEAAMLLAVARVPPARGAGRSRLPASAGSTGSVYLAAAATQTAPVDVRALHRAARRGLRPTTRPSTSPPSAHVDAAQVQRARGEIGRGRHRASPATLWRIGHRRQPRRLAGRARSMFFLHVLTGSVGTPGGTQPQRLGQVHRPRPGDARRRTRRWNELLWPIEYPLTHLRDVASCCRTCSRTATAARSTSTSRGSTTRSGPTPTASPGSRCSPTSPRSGCTSR